MGFEAVEDVASAGAAAVGFGADAVALALPDPDLAAAAGFGLAAVFPPSLAGSLAAILAALTLPASDIVSAGGRFSATLLWVLADAPKSFEPMSSIGVPFLPLASWERAS